MPGGATIFGGPVGRHGRACRGHPGLTWVMPGLTWVMPGLTWVMAGRAAISGEVVPAIHDFSVIGGGR
jgi:hypothetical protein